MAVLEGRVAFVTGGAKGIGIAYCEALVAAGATVIVADIVDPEPCVARLRAASPTAKVFGLRFDVSVEREVAAAVAAAADLAGGIDILVNNAALFATLPPADVTDTMVHGRWLMRHRRLLTLDERAIRREALRYQAQVRASLLSLPSGSGKATNE